jgi:hypothetical protein
MGKEKVLDEKKHEMMKIGV